MAIQYDDVPDGDGPRGPYNGLENRRLQPLGHLSGARNIYVSRDFRKVSRAHQAHGAHCALVAKPQKWSQRYFPGEVVERFDGIGRIPRNAAKRGILLRARVVTR